MICLLLVLAGAAGTVLAQEQAGPAGITILSPQPNDVVQVANLAVAGTAIGLPEGNVVVRALDAQGNILAEQPTVVDPTTGAWQAILNPQVEAGTQGAIYAYSPSPADGTIVAEATIPVLFGQPAPEQPVAPVEPEQPVQLPEVEPTLPPEPEQPIQLPEVEPTLPPEPEPTQLPEVEPTLPPEPEPTRLPEIEPTLPPEPEPTRLPEIEPTPTQLPVPIPTNLPEPEPAAIKIFAPSNGDVVNTERGVTVSGRAANLFENNVVVRITAGNVELAQEATTADQNGNWSVTLVVGSLNTPAVITAYSPDPIDGSTVAKDTINVRLQTTIAPEPAFISIEQPADGSIINPENGLSINGLARNLFENNVVVSVSAGGFELAQSATTADSAGNWSITLDVGSVASEAVVRAYSPSPQGGNDAEDSIAIVLQPSAPTPTTTPTPTPTATPTPQFAFIQVVSPPHDALVSTDQGVTIAGLAEGTFENNVVVRITSGNVKLAEEATTADSAGRWQVTLFVGPVNAPALIQAFSTSPADGTLEAEDRVHVLLQTNIVHPPVPPAIRIQSPPSGATVDASSGFFVSGTALNTFENNVIVRARDSFGRTVAQSVTTADINGNWSVNMRMLLENGSAGSIYAFSTSPVDGRIEADDLVSVTYASSCTSRTDWPIYVVQPGDTLFSIGQRTGSTVGELIVANCLPNPNVVFVGQRLRVPQLPDEIIIAPNPGIKIESQVMDDSVPVNVSVVMTGIATGTTPGNVFVRLLDGTGNVIDEVRGEVTSTDPDDGSWLWEAEATTYGAINGARGSAYAYSINFLDGTTLVDNAVNIIYGLPDEKSYITIDDPQPYANVGLDGEVTISGRARGLFEGNVVVRLIDDKGVVLHQEPTTMPTEEPGGEGEWSITLPVESVIRGRISAFSTSPADGSISAEAAIDVTFGDPSEEDSYAVFTHPLPNTVVTDKSNFFSAAGYADGVFDESVFMILLDEDSEIRLSMPVAIDPESGFWSITSRDEISSEKDQTVSLRLLASSPTDGFPLARDRLSLVTRRANAHLTGTATYLQRSALPEDAVVKVSVRNASLADAPPEATLLGEQIITNPGQVPIAFAVPYNTGDVDERVIYSVGVRIEDSTGQLLFISTTSYPIIEQGTPIEDVEVLVEPVQ
jgi:uncharacterized lipoprotein YbaY/LysM repeat protein